MPRLILCLLVALAQSSQRSVASTYEESMLALEAVQVCDDDALSLLQNQARPWPRHTPPRRPDWNGEAEEAAAMNALATSPKLKLQSSGLAMLASKNASSGLHLPQLAATGIGVVEEGHARYIVPQDLQEPQVVEVVMQIQDTLSHLVPEKTKQQITKDEEIAEDYAQASYQIAKTEALVLKSLLSKQIDILYEKALAASLKARYKMSSLAEKAPKVEADTHTKPYYRPTSTEKTLSAPLNYRSSGSRYALGGSVFTILAAGHEFLR